MHFVTPRGTQCDTLCIIASIFLLIFATESREKKKVNFVFKWQSSRVHFNTSVWCKRLVPLVLEKPLLQDQDSLKMGNNKSIHRGSVK